MSHLSFPVPTTPMHLLLSEVQISITSTELDEPAYLPHRCLVCRRPGWFCKHLLRACLANSRPVWCCIDLLWCYLACLPPCLALYEYIC